MKKVIINLLVTSLIATLLSGCASSYKPINVTSVNFNASEKKNGVEFSYKYDVLREAGNKKMAKKESNSSKKVVAIKITNNSDTNLVIGKDLFLYAGQNKLTPVSPLEMKSSIKQNVAGYLPYALLTLMKLTITKNFDTKVYNIGYIIGPLITIGNMGTANGSNKRFAKNLSEYDVFNKEIKKGETFYGLMGVSEPGFQALSIKLKNEVDK